MRKLVILFLTICMLLASFPLPACAADGEPTPPDLHSEAAILMDADTGQVVWGKNMHTTMYPASLTKVVTCLLAMEHGDPQAVVTMTDEGVFSVPRATTHAALTTGEKLTLEQLEYTMMVESANDAANGIAIHISGSIESFADIMNKEAKWLGAKDTHFTNANGLPDPNHYTSAYDLALFTKAALKFPEFRSLAGTKQYIVPPTNLQPQSRKFNNRQYMFCLNDTYPGAFAGKTGWTEEAGKTLITIAERDGVTLIAVVLKAAGVVDAEFVDSTKLLDYGYDNFSRVTVSKDNVPPQAVKNGKILTLEQDMPVLLPNGISADSLTVRVDTSNEMHPMVQLLAQGLSASMEPLAGEFALVEKPAEVIAPAAPEPNRPKFEFHWNKTFLNVLKWIGIVLGVLAAAALVGFIILLLLRQRALTRQRKRKEALEEKRRLRERAFNERTPSERELLNYSADHYIDVTLDKNRKNRISVVDEEDLPPLPPLPPDRHNHKKW